MSAGLVAVVTVIYIGVSASELYHGNNAMALVFFGYTIGNLGFIWGML